MILFVLADSFHTAFQGTTICHYYHLRYDADSFPCCKAFPCSQDGPYRLLPAIAPAYPLKPQYRSLLHNSNKLFYAYLFSSGKKLRYQAAMDSATGFVLISLFSAAFLLISRTASTTMPTTNTAPPR